MWASQPQVWLEGDSHERAMATHGDLVGFSSRRAVWRFGFLSGSLLAKAFDCWVVAPTWVLAFHSGIVIDVFEGLRESLPLRFQRIIYCTVAPCETPERVLPSHSNVRS